MRMCSRYASTRRDRAPSGTAPTRPPQDPSPPQRRNAPASGPDLRQPVKRLGEEVVAGRHRDLAPVRGDGRRPPRLDPALSTTSSWMSVAVCKTSMAVDAVSSALPSGSPIRALRTSRIGRLFPPAVNASAPARRAHLGHRTQPRRAAPRHPPLPPKPRRGARRVGYGRSRPGFVPTWSVMMPPEKGRHVTFCNPLRPIMSLNSPGATNSFTDSGRYEYAQASPETAAPSRGTILSNHNR